MAPRFVIAGNWKLHHGPDETRRFLEAFSPAFEEGKEPVLLLFPPSLSVGAAVQLKGVGPVVDIGVQNIYWEPSGAFTGEISGPLARAAGATYALVGHSERRHVFGETDADVARKVIAAMDAGLVPVVCVGESLEERRDGRVAEVILGQLAAVLSTLQERPEAPVMLAYEPVWAIGTGETATPGDASEAHGVLRIRLTEALGEDRAREIPILYGGSVKPGNAKELLAAPDVDGVLVGGASLDPESFSGIAEAVNDLPKR